MANANNLAGHRARYEHLQKTVPAEKLGEAYVGAKAEAAAIGFMEEHAIRRHCALDGAYLIDLGCGIGRLTQRLVDSPVRAYLGTDILPEILAEAAKVGAARPTFRFAITADCSIPEKNDQADIVCGFSIITHLLDEEAFTYFHETARVLKPGGVALFSFLDFSHERHRAMFVEYAKLYKVQRDLLKFFEKNTLATFAELAGLDVIEVVDGLQEVPPPGSPPSTTSGQSTIYMRKSVNR